MDLDQLEWTLNNNWNFVDKFSNFLTGGQWTLPKANVHWEIPGKETKPGKPPQLCLTFQPDDEWAYSRIEVKELSTSIPAKEIGTQKIIHPRAALKSWNYFRKQCKRERSAAKKAKQKLLAINRRQISKEEPHVSGSPSAPFAGSPQKENLPPLGEPDKVCNASATNPNPDMILNQTGMTEATPLKCPDPDPTAKLSPKHGLEGERRIPFMGCPYDSDDEDRIQIYDPTSVASQPPRDFSYLCHGEGSAFY